MSNYKSSVSAFLAAVGITIFAVACGGGGGGSSSGGGLTVSGTLSSARALARAGSAQSGITVCALGSCDETKADGTFSFEVGNDWPGGPVEFTFTGNGVNSTASVDINAGLDEVIVSFVVVSPSTVSITNVDEIVDDSPDDNSSSSSGISDDGSNHDVNDDSGDDSSSSSSSSGSSSSSSGGSSSSSGDSSEDDHGGGSGHH